MLNNFTSRIFGVLNLFKKKEFERTERYEDGPFIAGSRGPHKSFFRGTNTRTIVNGIYSRIAIDTCLYQLKHVVRDSNGQVKEIVNSDLSSCLNLTANTDQSGPDFMTDLVWSMLDEGVVAAVPIDIYQKGDSSFDVLSLRTGKILGWYPQQIKVQVYNEQLSSGRFEELVVPKQKTAIIQNPLYSVMNEKGSYLNRLTEKLSLLDVVDNQSASKKLDLLMQLPFNLRSESRRNQAETRRKELETQLSNGEFGIAYIDAVEKVTQLNRPVGNGILPTVQYLTEQLYSQMGLTPGIFAGTANDQEMLNYHVRTVRPILRTICTEFTRKFFSKTAITRGHSIDFFIDPFAFIAPTALADFMDKASRNEVLSGNELRSGIGYLPSKQEGADELRNKNINQKNELKPTGLEGEKK